jgi:hypothetical protein
MCLRKQLADVVVMVIDAFVLVSVDLKVGKELVEPDM